MAADVLDSSSLQNVMQTIEQACSALQTPQERAAAESVLLSFRKSHRPFQACQFIMEHSQMANARFQAAATFQESTIREWNLLTTDEKCNMRNYCLHYTMTRAAAPEAYVQSKVASVAAVLTKRGWLEMAATEKETFFNEVKQAVVGAHGVAGQIAGLSYLESLVSEFSPSTASVMGLSAEFHEHCRSSLELDYLQKFYTWALDAAFGMSEKVLQNTSMQLEVHVCASSLRLMSQILNWEFRGSLINGAGYSTIKNRGSAFSLSYDYGSGKRGEQGAFVQPGASWKDLLLSMNHTNWILQFYSCIRQHTSERNWIDSPICVSARQLIIQLCSLTGNIFPSDKGATQEQHLQYMLTGILPWISPPASAISAIQSGRSESELLDGLRALGSIASLSSPAVFESFLIPLGGSTFGLLSSLTEVVIKANSEKHDSDDTWMAEAMDSLLDTWTYLLQPSDLSKRIPFPESGVRAAAAVFQTFAYTELEVAAASAEDDDVSEQLQAVIAARDERLTAFALIARASPAESVSLLAKLLSERFCFLCEFTGNRSCPTSLLEELHFILIMSGHVLADPGGGETPMVPEGILAHFHGTKDPASHPAVILSRSAISLAQMSLDMGSGTASFSARLMEAVLWFFARWIDTYLLPVDAGRGPSSTPSGTESGTPQVLVENQRNPVIAAFSEQGDGTSALECLVRLAVVTLTSWPGEKTLLEITCFQFLPALSRRRNLCSYLVQSETWQHLAKAFAFLDQALISLPSTIQRGIAEVLCRSATGLSGPDETKQFLADLFSHLNLKLSEIAHNNELSLFAQKPEAILLVINLIERLRGAARATMPRSQKAMFDIGAAAMNPLLRLLEAYKNESSVVYVLLKYVVDWVDGQVAFLEAKETAMIFNFCVRLLQIYSTHNIGKVSLSMSKSLYNEYQVEKYKDLRALLQLLTNLSSKDLIDFASDESNETENADVAQVVYLGLHIVIPLITIDLLKYPKLCRQYFTLLAHMLEVYPDKIAKLPKEAFFQIVNTLEYGLKLQDIEVVNTSLTAVSGIAIYHYNSICKGEEGLGIHASGTWDGSGTLQQGVLAHFLVLVMRHLLFQDYSNELVDAAADALFPLILCNTQLYQALAQDLLKEQQHTSLQNRLTAAFNTLMSGNQLSASLDRMNRRRFRENLYIFLAEVRGFLRMR